MQNVIAYRVKDVAVTPTVSSGVAYSANDQVGGLQTITLPTDVSYSSVGIAAVHVVDSSAQTSTFNTYFFASEPTLTSSDNQPLNIPKADWASYLSGYLAISSWTTTGSSSVGSSNDAATTHFVIPSSLRQFYVAVSTAGTPTFTSTDSLTFIYTLQMHY